MQKTKPLIIFIVGPTSSGKSRVAAFLASKINGKIISCDSMQVYKDMPVINQAPTEDILSMAEHYLVEEISPEEEFNAARFAGMAEEYIEEITSADMVPVVAGGTGLYVKALLDGLFDAPSKDEELRSVLEKESEEFGNEYLYEKLKKIDPVTAAKLHVNDKTRVIRAIEVYEVTGCPISEKQSEAEGIYNKYDCRIFGLRIEREILYKRIEETVDKMIATGLVRQVESIVKRKLSITAQKALGIKEISDYLKGKYPLEEAIAELKKNTRRYAKRQMTWFNADKRIEWIDADREIVKIVEDVLGRIT